MTPSNIHLWVGLTSGPISAFPERILSLATSFQSPNASCVRLLTSAGSIAQNSCKSFMRLSKSSTTTEDLSVAYRYQASKPGGGCLLYRRLYSSAHSCNVLLAEACCSHASCCTDAALSRPSMGWFPAALSCGSRRKFQDQNKKATKQIAAKGVRPCIRIPGAELWPPVESKA